MILQLHLRKLDTFPEYLGFTEVIHTETGRNHFEFVPFWVSLEDFNFALTNKIQRGGQSASGKKDVLFFVISRWIVLAQTLMGTLGIHDGPG